MELCRPGRHPIRGPQDRLPNGGCRGCDREAQAKHRAKRQAALAWVRALEARGVRVDPDDLTLSFGGVTASAEALADRMVTRWGDLVE